MWTWSKTGKIATIDAHMYNSIIQLYLSKLSSLDLYISEIEENEH